MIVGRDAEADGQIAARLRFFTIKRALLDFLTNLFGNFAGDLLRGFGEDDGEFLATVAAEDIRAAQSGANQLADRF